MGSSPSDHVINIVPAIRFGGVNTHLRLSEDMSTCNGSVLSIFDLDEVEAVRTLNSPVVRLRIPMDRFREEETIIRNIMEVFNAIKPTLVHTHHCFSDFYAIPAAKRVGLKTIRSVHGITQVSWSNPFSRSVIRTDWPSDVLSKELALDPEVLLTLVVSNELRERLLGYGFSSRKVRVCYPGIDTDSLNEEPTEPCISEDDIFRIGFPHRLEPIKNPWPLLAAVKLLMNKGVKTKVFAMAGGRLSAEFANAFSSVELNHCIALIPPGPDIWGRLPRLDVVVVTSLSEGTPMVMLEAMSKCIPVVATSVGGIPEIITDGVSGYLVDAGDQSGLEKILLAVASNANARKEVGRTGRDVVKEKYSRASYLSRMQSIYSEFISN